MKLLTPKHKVPSVDSAIRILELLTKEEFRGATLTALSTELEINKSTCLRILKTLDYNDLIRYDESLKTYSLGPNLIPLGQRAKELNDYIRVATSFLPELANIGITFVLVKRGRGADLLYVAKQEPPLKVRLTVSTGDSFPIPAGALGKIYYSYMPEEESDKIVSAELNDGRLPVYTQHSILTVDELRQQKELILKDGIAESHEEYSPGISGYACPIFDNEGNVILALGSYLPSTFVNYIDVEDLKQTIKTAADNITKAIANLV